MRRMIMSQLLVIGFVVQGVSYFLMATPWGFPPSSEVYSNPRVPFAPVIFIAGILLTFLGVLLYELMPERRRD